MVLKTKPMEKNNIKSGGGITEIENGLATLGNVLYQFSNINPAVKRDPNYDNYWYPAVKRDPNYDNYWYPAAGFYYHSYYEKYKKNQDFLSIEQLPLPKFSYITLKPDSNLNITEIDLDSANFPEILLESINNLTKNLQEYINRVS